MGLFLVVSVFMNVLLILLYTTAAKERDNAIEEAMDAMAEAIEYREDLRAKEQVFAHKMFLAKDGLLHIKAHSMWGVEENVDRIIAELEK